MHPPRSSYIFKLIPKIDLQTVLKDANKISIFLLAILIVLPGCIGTDFLDENAELFEPRIEITPPLEAIEVNQSLTYNAVYYDNMAAQQSASFSWISSDESIVRITQDGVATGVGPGQARITASAFNVMSETALLTVVADPNQVALVRVSPSDTSITVSNTLQYTAIAENAAGDVLPDLVFQWSTSIDTVAQIDDQGLLTGINPGNVLITASTEGIESMPAELDVFARSRNGSFRASPGTSYQLSGTAVLEQSDTGLQLRFLDNFSVSNGPDLHVYLSTADRINASSIDLGDIKGTSGAQTYGVPSNVNMNDFDYVIIHCLPFNVTFGFAKLN